MQSNSRVNDSRWNDSRVNDSANNSRVNNSQANDSQANNNRVNASHLPERKKPFTQPATGSQDPAVKIRQLAVVNNRAVVNGCSSERMNRGGGG